LDRFYFVLHFRFLGYGTANEELPSENFGRTFEAAAAILIEGNF